MYKSLYTFGWNNSQLGYEKSEGFPKKVEGIDNIKFVALGGSHVCQLGLGDTKDRQNFTEVKLELKEKEIIVSISAGDQHSVFVTNQERCYVFGKNFMGQIGMGNDKGNKLVPTSHKVLSTRNIVKVSCGGRHTCFIDKNGDIWTTGWGKYGQLGHGTNVEVFFPKQIDANETGGTSFSCIDVKCKDCFNVALSDKYEVFIFGGKKYQEIVTSEKNLKNNVPRKLHGNVQGRRVIDVAASADHGITLTNDGSVFVFGFSLDNLGYVSFLNNIIKKKDEELCDTAKKLKEEKLDLSEKFVIKSDFGNLKMYKVHFFKEGEVVQVAATEKVCFALTKNGEVYSFGGSGEKSALGHGNDVKKLLKPKKIEYFSKNKIFVSKIVTGAWHVACLGGTDKDFRWGHLNLGQKVPKIIQRMEKV